MDIDPTLNVILVAVGGLLTALCGWRGARPPDLARGPRMIPWRFLMLLGMTFTVVMLAFLAHHYGLIRDTPAPY